MCVEAWLNSGAGELAESGRGLQRLPWSEAGSQRNPSTPCDEPQGGDPKLSAPIGLHSRDEGRARGLEKRDREPRRPRSPACWLFPFVGAAATPLSSGSERVRAANRAPWREREPARKGLGRSVAGERRGWRGAGAAGGGGSAHRRGAVLLPLL